MLWIERATPVGIDMDNARIQGGANHIEIAAGHTGKGVRGHVMEGIHAAHPEYAANAFRTAPAPVLSGQATNHGNSTFGEVFSAGVNPAARGLCPDGQGYFTDGGGDPDRSIDIGAGFPTDPQTSLGVGGTENRIYIQKSGSDLQSIEAEDVDASGRLLYWREMP